MNVGGPAELLVQLLEGLPDQALLTGEVDEGEADHLVLRSPQTPFMRVPGLGRSPRTLDDARALAFLIAEVRRRRPDVVHTHTAKAGALGRVAARAARVPVVVHTFHGHLLHGYFSKRATQAVVATERALAHGTDRLVAVGEQVRDDLLAQRVGRPAQYAVIPPGVRLPTPPTRLAARRQLGVAPEATVVASVGRLIGIKRPDRMLAVAARLPQVIFIVAGEGPLLEQMRREAPPNVRFLGWRRDVEVVHAAADVALLTSDNEGMPLSLIEAALCGTPAVSTDVGSAREVVVGETAPADPDALAAAVLRVAQGDLGELARQQAHSRFSPQAMLAAHARMYEELVARKPRRKLSP